MKNYLQAVAADYNYTLTVPCQVSIPEKGLKQQILHKLDNGTYGVVTVSSQSYFEVSLSFPVLTVAEAAIIFGLWHDENKANGSENTFYWTHPTDGNTYTVRFLEVITRGRSHGTTFDSIDGVVLNIEGYKS